MDLKRLMNKQTDVSLAFARHVSLEQQEKKSNLILSPLSINVVVSLIAAGASGPILKQLLSYLKLGSIDDANGLSSEIISSVFADGTRAGGPNLSIANAVWIQKDLPLKSSFQHVLKSFYNATSYQVDFLTKAKETVSQVNSWAEKETNGLIKKVLDRSSINANTRLILANALYFKGTWDQQFDASRTRVYDFYLFGEDSVKTPFMTNRKSQFIKNFDSFKVLRLRYKQGQDKRQFSMYIFLPHTKDGLSSLVDKLDSEIGFLDKHLPHFKVEVNEFRLPKFKISFGFKTSQALKKLGVSDAFTNGGLTEMVDSLGEGEKLFVSEIFHNSCIEVNEEGTEAAAVSTGVKMAKCANYSPSRMDFVADHPFLFVIREDVTGVVLFVGHVLNPLL